MTLIEEAKSYFESLTATNEIRDNFGAAFSFNTNLFLGVVPASPTECVVIRPRPGSPPEIGVKYAYNSGIGIRVRCNTYQKGYKVSQAIINNLHLNDNICASVNGKFYAINSQPTVLYSDEEEYPQFDCLFEIRHTKYDL